MSVTIACIGSGNMGFALMKGAAGTIGGENIGFADFDLSKVQAAAQALGSRVYASNLEAAEKGDYIFLAVKPQILEPVLEEIAPVIRRRQEGTNAPMRIDAPVLVSMAAGWSIGRIQDLVAGTMAAASQAPSGKLPVAKPSVLRIMPNTPALISKGMIALAASSEVPAEKIAEIEKILAGAGQVDRIDERYLDAVTGLSGSGPAFVYTFIEALADGGVRAGLQRDKALRYAVQTVLGSAAMVQESGRHPGALKDMVASPGGTTIAGIAALEAGAFRGTVMQAVEAAWRRSKELA
ncbi:MAG: pyrroline-5-carboxylate reductase [Treponema sp.]|jgi:pyrroline-5-carboxylate reductase|nr:pyrroline-5-carboxylate reductase [Treponema sp.]